MKCGTSLLKKGKREKYAYYVHRTRKNGYYQFLVYFTSNSQTIVRNFAGYFP